MKRNSFLLLFFLLILQLGFSQNQKRYWLEIPNNSYVPEIDPIGVGLIQLKVDEGLVNGVAINQIFDSFTIYKFLDLFSTSSNTYLMNRYVIDLSSADDLSDLTSVFSSLYPSFYFEEEGELLYVPNDYENSNLLVNTKISNYDDYEQKELDMIRAQEAWDITTGNSNVILGIVDNGFYDGHEDLTTEILGGLSGYNTLGVKQHGNRVAGFASAATDNGLGISSIGFNTKMVVAKALRLSPLLQLVQTFDEVKVTNCSWHLSSSPFPPYQAIIDMIDALGVTMVFAAGNGESDVTEDPNDYYYPASYKNVISVSTVGNKNEIGSTNIDFDNWKDIHQCYNHSVNKTWSHQHNDSIDIVVPAYYASPTVWKDGVPGDIFVDDYRRSGWGGTSFSAPIVTGTIGLLYSVNYCLDSREIETVLKLTAVVVDTILENLPYYGKLGAGRLDAFEAVNMANEMKKPFGTVEVKNRILYRPWFYKLVTAPYEIKMFNNIVTDSSKLKFRARANIEILSGLYYPEGGYVDLQIDPALTSCEVPPLNLPGKSNNTSREVNEELQAYYLIAPTMVETTINIEEVSPKNMMSSIKIFDFFNQLVFERSQIRQSDVELKLDELISGLYILKIYDQDGGELFTTKFVKK